MADVMIQEDTLHTIADAIRAKASLNQPLSLRDIISTIPSIESFSGAKMFLYKTVDELNSPDGWALSITHDLGEPPGFAAAIVTDPFFFDIAALGWFGTARSNAVIKGDYTILHEDVGVSNPAAQSLYADNNTLTIKAPAGVILPKDTRLFIAVSDEKNVQKLITGIQLNHTELDVTDGESVKLDLEIIPQNFTEAYTVSWSTSNSRLAVVDSDGTVTIPDKAEGIATITCAVSTQSYNRCSSTCKLNIEPLVKRFPPTVTLSLSTEDVTNEDGSVTQKIAITGQSDIGVNPDNYYDEYRSADGKYGHGILIVNTRYLGNQNLIYSTSAASKKIFTSYKEDGSFVSRLTPTTVSTTYAFRAYVYYEKPDGSRAFAYSDVLRASYNSLKS